MSVVDQIEYKVLADLKNFCGSQKSCENCPFYGEGFFCDGIPWDWEPQQILEVLRKE